MPLGPRGRRSPRCREGDVRPAGHGGDAGRERPRPCSSRRGRGRGPRGSGRAARRRRRRSPQPLVRVDGGPVEGVVAEGVVEVHVRVDHDGPGTGSDSRARSSTTSRPWASLPRVSTTSARSPPTEPDAHVPLRVTSQEEPVTDLDERLGPRIPGVFQPVCFSTRTSQLPELSRMIASTP